MCGFKFLRQLLIQNESDKESFTLTLTKNDLKKKKKRKNQRKKNTIVGILSCLKTNFLATAKYGIKIYKFLTLHYRKLKLKIL